MVYTIANLYLIHGLLKFIYDNNGVATKQLTVENGDHIAKGGTLQHPRERISMLARMATELGLIEQTSDEFRLLPPGKAYVEMMGENIWDITRDQAYFLRDLFFKAKKGTRLAETVSQCYLLLKKYKIINPNNVKDEYSDLIGRQDWNTVTRLDKFKFTLNYLCDMGLAKRDKGQYILIDELPETLSGTSLRCTKVQKRPSPEIESLATGESILIVKDSSIARNTLLYPAHSGAQAIHFKDVESAQKAIDRSRGGQLTLEYFIYPVKVYKLKNKPEVALFASEFQPWTAKAFEDWQPGKTNIIAALLRVYKTNPITVKPIGNMNIVPLPTPVELTNLTPVVSDEEFIKQANEIEQALNKYDLVESKRIYRTLFKLNMSNNQSQWAEFQAEGLIGFDYDNLGDIKALQQKYPPTNSFAMHLNNRGFNHAWYFFEKVTIGDLFVLTGDHNEILGIGKVASDYIYDSSRESLKHIRKIRWLYTKPLNENPSSLSQTPITQPKFTTLSPEEWSEIQRDGRFAKVVQHLNEEIGIDIEPFATSTPSIAKDHQADTNPKSLITHITSYVANKGFTYSTDDLKNYYLSLKAKPFVILAGISGTGKTKLVRLFAEAIGVSKENGRYNQIAIRPDWNDSSDLFGFNDINGRFKPGPLTTAIKQANLNPLEPYIICLDEMNLSRVEYYFSDFLSLIETRDKNGFSDPLFKPEFFMNEDDRHTYSNLRLSPNLYVIGTVNMDETTFPFSKKVLDRANTIEFSSVKLLPPRPSTLVEIPDLVVPNEILQANYCTLNDCLTDHYDYVTSIIRKLEEVNKILEKANLQVGYRVRDEICFYILYNKQYGLLDEDDAFDYQLMQKILPRIQGSNGVLATVLLDLFRLSSGKDFSKDNLNVGEEAQKYVQEVATLKPYPRTARKLANMLWRFEDGFTSFWS